MADVTGEAPAVFAALAAAEAARRGAQQTDSLEALERTYFGPEVGAIRRRFNAVTRRHMAPGAPGAPGGDLLDFGCGGPWWKDEMWAGFASVTACDVDRAALLAVGRAHPRATLWHTANGTVASEARFDVVLSSSVLGYVLPAQAELHVGACHALLKDGGRLVLTRVLAHGLGAFLRGRRLVAVGEASFAYHYTRAELVALLRRHGFRRIRYVHLGARLPGISWPANQALYGAVPWLMAGLLPRLAPFLRIQHMLVAEK
jgi:2-polyprenyl-3-methyl-5-hydroxy-6-metoxy-1,4-benzoquinol methylase